LKILNQEITNNQRTDNKIEEHVRKLIKDYYEFGTSNTIIGTLLKLPRTTVSSLIKNILKLVV